MSDDYALRLDMAYNCLLRHMADLDRTISREEYNNAYDVFHSMMWNKFEWLDICISTAKGETDCYLKREYRVYEKFNRGKLAVALCSIFPSSNCLDWRKRPDKKYSKEEQIEHLLYLKSILDCYIDENKKDYDKKTEFMDTYQESIEDANKILNILLLIKKQLQESNEQAEN